MKKFCAVLLAAVIFIGGCSDVEENYIPEPGTEQADESLPDIQDPHLSDVAQANIPAAEAPSKTDPEVSPDGVPEIIQSSENGGGKLSFTLENVFSEGEYFTINISGEKSADKSASGADSAYINGELYENLKMQLFKSEDLLDELEIDVPDGERFLILESVAEGLSYGCELLSNKRAFSVDEYPDLIQLDFFRSNEIELPQYARYFAVFGDKLTELPVYENGGPAAPFGTHLETRSAGFMVQHLCRWSSGGELMVVKYEYTFDTENRRLDRKEVRFLGWDN